jgi:hypothetical protein
MEAIKAFLSYTTVRQVSIRNWKWGLLYYFLVVSIIAYIAGWVIYYNRGYQQSYTMIGVSVIKVKGASYFMPPNATVPMVWDEYDSVVPAMEMDAFFVTTAYWTTDQTRGGTCPGNDLVTEGCDPNNPASVPPPYTTTLNGVSTGVCDPNTNMTILWAWCPVEQVDAAVGSPNILQGVENQTVYLRLQASFPDFDATLSNVNTTTPIMGYNLFTIRDMIPPSSVPYNASVGAIIVIQVQWNCDFDYDPSKCQPTLAYRRVDPITSGTLAGKTSGFNFRYPLYFASNASSDHSRTLVKVYGYRFVALVSGYARKFSVIPLMVNIGSGLGLLSVATVLIDILICYVVPKKEKYRDAKYSNLDDEASDDDPERRPLLSPPPKTA